MKELIHPVIRKKVSRNYTLKIVHELYQIRHVTLTVGWLDGWLTLNSTIGTNIIYQTFWTIDP